MTLYPLAGGLSLLLFCLLLALLWRRAARRRNATYRRLPTLFSPGERAFLAVLREVVGERALVFGKVRVADLLTPRSGLKGQRWWRAFNRISAKHVDFVLCDRDDCAVLCVVELNDASHQRRDRRERDAFLAEACAGAGLPLLQVTARARYPRADLEALLAPHLDSRHDTPVAPAIPRCTACAAPMVQRVARRGSHAGRAFWACSRFPACRHIEPIDRSQE